MCRIVNPEFNSIQKTTQCNPSVYVNIAKLNLNQIFNETEEAWFIRQDEIKFITLQESWPVRDSLMSVMPES